MYITTNAKVYKFTDYQEMSVEGNELIIVTTDRMETLRIPFASAENAREVLHVFQHNPETISVRALEGEWQRENPETGRMITKHIWISSEGPFDY